MFKALSCGEKINNCTLNKTGLLTNTKTPSHVLFKLALKDLLQAANYKQPWVRSVVYLLYSIDLLLSTRPCQENKRRRKSATEDKLF